MYSYADKQMSLLSQAYASQDVQTVANLQAGQLSPDGTQAVFVDNKIENDNGMQTDIYVLDQKNTTLRNLSQNSGTSTYRATTLYFCEDINGDAAIEVPAAIAGCAGRGACDRQRARRGEQLGHQQPDGLVSV